MKEEIKNSLKWKIVFQLMFLTWFLSHSSFSCVWQHFLCLLMGTTFPLFSWEQHEGLSDSSVDVDDVQHGVVSFWQHGDVDDVQHGVVVEVQHGVVSFWQHDDVAFWEQHDEVSFFWQHDDGVCSFLPQHDVSCWEQHDDVSFWEDEQHEDEDEDCGADPQHPPDLPEHVTRSRFRIAE